MLTPHALELTKRIGRKDFELGAIIRYGNDYSEFYATYNGHYCILFEGKTTIIDSTRVEYVEIIGHPAHIKDIYRWTDKNTKAKTHWYISLNIQKGQGYILSIYGTETQINIPYNPILPLYEQKEVCEQLLTIIK